MRYRRLGSSDLEISEISLGSWLTYGGGIGREMALLLIDLVNGEATNTSVMLPTELIIRETT